MVAVAAASFAWQLAQEVITAPIVGIRKFEQLEAALGAVDVQLATDEIERLNQVTATF